MGGALYGAVGSGEEECHILAVDGEGEMRRRWWVWKERVAERARP